MYICIACMYVHFVYVYVRIECTHMYVYVQCACACACVRVCTVCTYICNLYVQCTHIKLYKVEHYRSPDSTSHCLRQAVEGSRSNEQDVRGVHNTEVPLPGDLLDALLCHFHLSAFEDLQQSLLDAFSPNISQVMEPWNTPDFVHFVQENYSCHL